IDDARAGRIVRDVLDGLVPAGVADAVAGAHVLARQLAGRPDPAARARATRDVLVGLRLALTDEPSGEVVGGGLLDVLSGERILASLVADPSKALERDLVPALTAEAERLAGAGDATRADLLLLSVA